MAQALPCEAARAAALAAHAAAGLAHAAGVRQAARALRAAEALSRSAVALLASPTPAAASRAAGAAPEAAGPPRPRQARTRRGRGRAKPQDRQAEHVDGLEGDAVMQTCAPGTDSAPDVAGETLKEADLAHPVLLAAGTGAARVPIQRHIPGTGQRGNDASRAAGSSSAVPASSTLATGPAMRARAESSGTSSTQPSAKAGYIDPRDCLCTCSYNGGLSRKRRCVSCGWVFSVAQLADLPRAKKALSID